MKKSYIYVKIWNNENVISNLNVRLKNKFNKTVFSGKTDCFGKLKIPVCDNEVYKLFVYQLVIPLIAKSERVYSININNEKKQFITTLLMDKNYPNIKIEGGEMILWQDIQFQ